MKIFFWRRPEQKITWPSDMKEVDYEGQGYWARYFPKEEPKHLSLPSPYGLLGELSNFLPTHYPYQPAYCQPQFPGYNPYNPLWPWR